MDFRFKEIPLHTYQRPAVKCFSVKPEKIVCTSPASQTEDFNNQNPGEQYQW